MGGSSGTEKAFRASPLDSDLQIAFPYVGIHNADHARPKADRLMVPGDVSVYRCFELHIL